VKNSAAGDGFHPESAVVRHVIALARYRADKTANHLVGDAEALVAGVDLGETPRVRPSGRG